MPFDIQFALPSGQNLSGTHSVGCGVPRGAAAAWADAKLDQIAQDDYVRERQMALFRKKRISAANMPRVASTHYQLQIRQETRYSVASASSLMASRT
jgi:hypothetical protein